MKAILALLLFCFLITFGGAWFGIPLFNLIFSGNIQEQGLCTLYWGIILLAGLMVLCTNLVLKEFKKPQSDVSLSCIQEGYSLIRVRLLDDWDLKTVYYYIKQGEQVDVGLVCKAEYEGEQQRVEVIEINVDPQEVLRDLYAGRTFVEQGR
ncbi:hypothetical protein [Parasporobacterium paucivorans]|uniref:Uncharacterized protein n=1 Tax=Parasporobacterium paucivorans DSM 15970 TaxID=1122934 RepID=A0A1M6KPG7_9FIRM|nr:hypothetical protein [Parasporobacterium paucivorans]SHJ60888.1 hypothetical protein SAMN02745691_02242 [Parasporobacterium paucivorans DSM 15970]